MKSPREYLERAPWTEKDDAALLETRKAWARDTEPYRRVDAADALALALRDLATSTTGAREPALGADRVRRILAYFSARSDDAWRAALLAAAYGAFDTVAALTGGRALPRRVGRALTFGRGAELELVRHLASCAKFGLGIEAGAPALRDWASWAKDPAALLVGASLVFHGAGAHPLGETAQRLDALLASDPAAPPRLAAVSLVDDAQVSIFERYVPELTGDTAALKSKLANAAVSLYSGPAARRGAGNLYALAWLRGLDREVAAAAANHSRDAGDIAPNHSWLVLACLGLAPADWHEVLSRRLDGFDDGTLDVRQYVRSGWATDAATVALAMERHELVGALCGRKLAPFSPRKAFGGDARAVLRYFASAVLAGASREDVEPAWLELLVAHVPGSQPRAIGGGLGWGGLFGLAFAYFCLLGDAEDVRVGHLLRSMLRGAPV